MCFWIMQPELRLLKGFAGFRRGFGLWGHRVGILIFVQIIYFCKPLLNPEDTMVRACSQISGAGVLGFLGFHTGIGYYYNYSNINVNIGKKIENE